MRTVPLSPQEVRDLLLALDRVLHPLCVEDGTIKPLTRAQYDRLRHLKHMLSFHRASDVLASAKRSGERGARRTP